MRGGGRLERQLCGASLQANFTLGFTKRAALLHGELPAEEFAGHWIKRQRPDRLGLQRAGSHRRRLLDSTLTNANFSFADLRGALMPSGPIQLARNTIREFGAINGLDLEAGETLVVRDSDIGITVNDSMNAVSGGTLELVLGDADWGSTMAVAAGVTPDLGGTLRVRFADQANLASMLGTTFDFFDWPAVLEHQ